MVKKLTKWEQHLPLLEFAYSNSKHTSIGYSHFMMMYDCRLQATIDDNFHQDELECA